MLNRSHVEHWLCLLCPTKCCKCGVGVAHSRTSESVQAMVCENISISFALAQGRFQPEVNDVHTDTVTHGSQSLLKVLLQQTKDKLEVRNQVIQVFIALQNKASTPLSNTIFLLSRSPETWIRLREETKHLNTDTCTVEDIKEAVLQNIFREGITLLFHSRLPSSDLSS